MRNLGAAFNAKAATAQMDKDYKILVTRSSMPEIDEFVDEIKSMWDSHWLTNMGPKHEELKMLLKQYLGVENLDLVVNGHMALELTLQALGLDGEVITTPFTFASTTHAIVRSGLVPVFCDIEKSTFTIDVEKIESLITKNTCAILPVHVYGNICNVDEIARIAKKYGIKVIYDAAHAFGETYNGTGIGNFGDASIFSFHATKVYNTIEGGAISFRSPELTDILWDLKNFGIHGPEEVTSIGANAKMNEFCAAMGICNLRHIDEEINKRKIVDMWYRERLEGIQGLSMKKVQKDITSNYAYFPILIDEKLFGTSRNLVFERLSRHGIGSRKYFYPITNSFSAFHGKYNVAQTPVALEISNKVLTLPFYADLSEKDVNAICDIVLDCKA